MLASLRIRNLAIIDELNLEFDSGFSVLTGETGAGKSILIDALGLVIGTRGDAALVRHGRERAEIDAEFQLHNAAGARAWLTEQELADPDDPEHCILRRVVGADGRTRAFVNGSPVSAGALRELGERLIDVFGQNESQTLLRGEVQRELLDAYGAHHDLLADCAAGASAWQDIQRNLERLRAAGGRDPAQLDYLRHQIDELRRLDLQPGELEQLDADHRRLANAGRLIGDGGAALEQLYGGDGSVFDQLSAVAGRLAALAALDPGFDPVERSLGEAQAQVREAAGTLGRLLDRLELDPQQLSACEQRIAAIQDLARKHRMRPEGLAERLTSLGAELDEAEQVAGGAERLEREAAAALAHWRDAAERLHQARLASAARFAEQVSIRARRLGMPNARLEVAVEAGSGERPRAHGNDEVRFDFSANPGQAPRPLARVASGGELSRLSLAIQVCSRLADGAPTLIFDEVDAGIGGGVAEIVGQELRALGQHRQVLCVTHLAQVASQGNGHYAIRKQVEDGQTYTQVSSIAADARVDELARMLGGADLSESTRQLARELVSRAGSGAGP